MGVKRRVGRILQSWGIISGVAWLLTNNLPLYILALIVILIGSNLED